jgi:hypothetical protein
MIKATISSSAADKYNQDCSNIKTKKFRIIWRRMNTAIQLALDDVYF